jgi:hypothetical protein
VDAAYCTVPRLTGRGNILKHFEKQKEEKQQGNFQTRTASQKYIYVYSSHLKNAVPPVKVHRSTCICHTKLPTVSSQLTLATTSRRMMDDCHSDVSSAGGVAGVSSANSQEPLPEHQQRLDIIISKNESEGEDDEHDFSAKDILSQIFWYIVDDHCIRPTQLKVHHVVTSLKEEGIWFWRDSRFMESQHIALKMANVQDQHELSQRKVRNDNQASASSVGLNENQFSEFVRPCANLFLKSFSEELVIPDWSTFTTDMAFHFNEVSSLTAGENAQYIPILKDADPEQWGLSICSVDGQRFSIGDCRNHFSLQSVSKPITSAMGLQMEGQCFVEQWVGCEPSGRPFNSHDLMPETNIPYNASMNSGAIISAGIVASRFPEQYVIQKWHMNLYG